MTVEELARSICQFVAGHAERESVFLTPVLEWSVNAADLLDHVSEVSGVSRQQLGQWVDEAHKQKETAS